MRNILFSILIFTHLFLFSQKSTNTISDGFWSTPGNWSNGLPNSNDTVLVNHDMTLDNGFVVSGNGVYTINGSLTDPPGGSIYHITLSNFAKLTVGNVSIEGTFSVNNSSTLTVNGCDTLNVLGNYNMSNSSTFNLANCAVLIVDQDANLYNSSSSLVHGKILIRGNLTSTNSSIMTGTGNLDVLGTVSIHNSASLFGSTTPCASGPCNYGSGSSLPVDLLSFNATLISPNQILAEWTTSSEINNDYFTLEYLTTEGEFKSLGQVKGAGNSNIKKKYTTSVSLIESSPIIYLRLKQTDFDGKVKTFNTISLKGLSSKLYASNQFDVYPNPSSHENLTISLNELKKGNFSIKISDVSGKLILNQPVQVIADHLNYKIELKGSNKLTKGIYFITFQSADQQFIKKHIVL